MNTLPLTIMGYLLINIISATTKLLSIEFLAHVGKTGLSLFSLGCCYVIGKSLYLLVNAGIEKLGEG